MPKNNTVWINLSHPSYIKMVETEVMVYPTEPTNMGYKWSFSYIRLPKSRWAVPNCTEPVHTIRDTITWSLSNNSSVRDGLSRVGLVLKRGTQAHCHYWQGEEHRQRRQRWGLWMWKPVWLISNREEGGGSLLCLALTPSPSPICWRGVLRSAARPDNEGFAGLMGVTADQREFFLGRGGDSLGLCANEEALIMVMCPLLSLTPLSLALQTPSFKLQILILIRLLPPGPAAKNSPVGKRCQPSPRRHPEFDLRHNNQYRKKPFIACLFGSVRQ